MRTCKEGGVSWTYAKTPQKHIKKPSTKALTSKPIKTATKIERIGHLSSNRTE